MNNVIFLILQVIWNARCISFCSIKIEIMILVINSEGIEPSSARSKCKSNRESKLQGKMAKLLCNFIWVIVCTLNSEVCIPHSSMALTCCFWLLLMGFGLFFSEPLLLLGISALTSAFLCL